MGINLDFSGYAQKKRDKRQTALNLLDSYLKENPDVTMGEAQEAAKGVYETGEVPDTLSTGRKISGMTAGKRKKYFRKNSDTGLLEPVDLGADVAGGDAVPTFIDYNPPDKKPTDQAGRLIVQKDDGTFGYVDQTGQVAPLRSAPMSTDKVVRPPSAGGAGETPAEKAARDTIQKYMAAVDDYADPADIPDSLTQNMKSAATALGMSVNDVTDIIKKRGTIAKFFGMKDVTRTTPVINFGAGRGRGGITLKTRAGAAPAGAGADQGDGQDTPDQGDGQDTPDQGDGQDTPDQSQPDAGAGGGRGAGGGAGGYGSAEEVRDAYRQGKITKEKAVRLLTAGF